MARRLLGVYLTHTLRMQLAGLSSARNIFLKRGEGSGSIKNSFERFFRDFKAQLFYPRTLDKRLFHLFSHNASLHQNLNPNIVFQHPPQLNIPIQNLVQKYFLFNAFLIPSLSLYGKL